MAPMVSVVEAEVPEAPAAERETAALGVSAVSGVNPDLAGRGE